MALVVLLRGANVGGHRTFKPAQLALEMSHLAVVNIGAAGTFVVRKPPALGALRTEFQRYLPFETDIIVCEGRDVLALVASDPFDGLPRGPDVVHFVSILASTPRVSPELPMRCPSLGAWEMQLLRREKRFLLGMYRRQMRAIGHLGRLDRLFGTPVTTRNWNTIMTIAGVLGRDP